MSEARLSTGDGLRAEDGGVSSVELDVRRALIKRMDSPEEKESRGGDGGEEGNDSDLSRRTELLRSPAGGNARGEMVTEFDTMQIKKTGPYLEEEEDDASQDEKVWRQLSSNKSLSDAHATIDVPMDGDDLEYRQCKSFCGIGLLIAVG